MRAHVHTGALHFVAYAWRRCARVFVCACLCLPVSALRGCDRARPCVCSDVQVRATAWACVGVHVCVREHLGVRACAAACVR
eukprot:3065237-Alexandrium_andersonii.AAC.1